MGQVYEAEETDSGRRVAVKLLSRGLGDDEERERFLREGQLAASLSHPNCVYVFGTSEIQGFPVIAMELVPEGTLKDLVVPGTPMAGAQAVDAILQVIAGPRGGGGDRDPAPRHQAVELFRPSRRPRPRRRLRPVGRDASARREAAAGTILGTPGFASPEQLRGDSLDVRSDIYSVGATLFYLLAGRAPFDDRDTITLMKRVASEAPPLLTTLRPDLPRGLAAIVAKCLAKTPAERYASYAALARRARAVRIRARSRRRRIVRRIVAGFLDTGCVGLPVDPAEPAAAASTRCSSIAPTATSLRAVHGRRPRSCTTRSAKGAGARRREGGASACAWSTSTRSPGIAARVAARRWRSCGRRRSSTARRRR